MSLFHLSLFMHQDLYISPHTVPSHISILFNISVQSHIGQGVDRARISRYTQSLECIICCQEDRSSCRSRGQTIRSSDCWHFPSRAYTGWCCIRRSWAGTRLTLTIVVLYRVENYLQPPLLLNFQDMFTCQVGQNRTNTTLDTAYVNMSCHGIQQ